MSKNYMNEMQSPLSPFSFKRGLYNTRILSRTNSRISDYAPDMVFQTIHPDDKDSNFILSFLNSKGSFSTSFSYDDPSNPQNVQELHYHDFFELLYVVNGEMYQQIESERHLYPEGSLCLLNCFIRHQEECSSDYRAIFLRLPSRLIEEFLSEEKTYYFDVENTLMRQVLKKFFADNINPNSNLQKEYIDFIPVACKTYVKEKMYKLFEILTRQMMNPQVGTSYMIKATILQIFHELSIQSHYETIPLNIGTDAEAQLFSSISALIRQNHGRISRKELEENLLYNGNYLNRITKKYTGLSLHQYGMNLAITESASMLQNTNMKIVDICNKLNFSNQTYFYKLFENAYGMTPKEYRNQVRRKE